MKKILLLCWLATNLCLTACGGGGGGGGGGSTPPSDPIITTAFYDSNYSIKTDGFYSMTRTADGVAFNFLDVSKLSLDKGYSVNFTHADFQAAGNGLIRASKLVPGMTYFGRALTVKHSIYLGSGAGLQYSQFGAWSSEVSGGLSPEAAAAPMTAGYASKKSALSASAGTAEFSGSAVAALTAKKNGNITWLEGTAKLFVNFGNLSNASLDLGFDEFYNFNISNINVGTATGEFDASKASLSLGGGANNTSGYTLTAPGLDFLEGQFYGNEANAPSEAVGRFWILEGDVGVAGAFGVKK